MIDDLNNYEVEANSSISFTELFTPQFMQQFTAFESIDELLSAGGFEVNSAEDYEAIPDEAIDAHVAKTTKFDSWQEMLTNALETSFSDPAWTDSKVSNYSATSF